MEQRFLIRSSQSGDVIEECGTVDEALKILRGYEEEDKQEGNYTEGFYEIYDAVREQIVL